MSISHILEESITKERTKTWIPIFSLQKRPLRSPKEVCQVNQDPKKGWQDHQKIRSSQENQDLHQTAAKGQLISEGNFGTFKIQISQK